MRNPNKRKNFDYLYTGKKIKVQKAKVQVLNIAELPGYWYDTEVTCRGCGIKFIHSARDKIRWYEIEKRPYNIIPVRCNDCSKSKKQAKAVCTGYAYRRLDSLGLNEAVEWMEAIKLLKSVGAEYNKAILSALQNRISIEPAVVADR